MAENLGYLVMMDSRFTVEEGTEILLDIIRRGLILPKVEKPDEPDYQCSVRDSKGLTVRLDNIRFDEKSYLPGIFGHGEICVPMEYVVTIQLQKSGGNQVATVTVRNGKQITLKVDRRLAVSGKTMFGEYNVPLEKISEISIYPKTSQASGSSP
jgi:hypothetical protein